MAKSVRTVLLKFKYMYFCIFSGVPREGGCLSTGREEER
jgi:hypothetical protein